MPDYSPCLQGAFGLPEVAPAAAAVPLFWAFDR
jgi:hypothetical protein